MQKMLLVGNWKMNPGKAPLAATLSANIFRNLRSLKRVTVVLCPPFPFLSTAQKYQKGSVVLGAQDVAPEEKNAHTGGVSASMLKSLGVRYVIVGHSERRVRGESNELVAEKVATVLAAGLNPILCVGERERDADGWHLSGVREQIEAVIKKVPKRIIGKLVVAYEPLWAIGAQAVREATPEESNGMVLFIRKVLTDALGASIANRMVVLYGGSVDEKNAEMFMTDGGVGGLLVGRASLEPKRFGLIGRILEGCKK